MEIGELIYAKIVRQCVPQLWIITIAEVCMQVVVQMISRGCLGNDISEIVAAKKACRRYEHRRRF